MAEQQSQSLSGADAIRSLTDKDAIYRAFDSYPWTRDKTFMVKLKKKKALNSPSLTSARSNCLIANKKLPI
jgi:hypothetical protein